MCDSYLKMLRYLNAFLTGSHGFGVLLETGSLFDPVYQGPESQHALALACLVLCDLSVVT